MIEQSGSLAGTSHELHDKGSCPARWEGSAPGRVFVLARGGLRNMCRPASVEGGFLGYGPTELFWKDVLELVHPDEEAVLRKLIAEVIEHPGTSRSVRVRVLVLCDT